jgi:hypothetical protein
MALINQDGKYIKLYQDGSYEIFASEATRDLQKAATSKELILAKYLEVILNLEKQEEFHYYDPEAFDKEYSAWAAEYQTYLYNLSAGISGEEYPLMASIYPDVSNSIPSVIERGMIRTNCSTLEDIYVEFKKQKYWGETQDA